MKERYEGKLGELKDVIRRNNYTITKLENDNKTVNGKLNVMNQIFDEPRFPLTNCRDGFIKYELKKVFVKKESPMDKNGFLKPI